MFGDIVPLAENLWLVLGDMPADVPNVLVYRKGDRRASHPPASAPAGVRAKVTGAEGRRSLPPGGMLGQAEGYERGRDMPS